MGDRETAKIRNFVAKHAETFNKPATHKDKKKYSKPKYERPVHEIDPYDEFLDESEVWTDD